VVPVVGVAPVALVVEPPVPVLVLPPVVAPPLTPAPVPGGAVVSAGLQAKREQTPSGRSSMRLCM
jgi:hypothetical protein